MRRFCLLAGMAGALGGCMVGPNYQPPKKDAPAAWTSPSEGGETNLPLTEARWWKEFHDPELDSLMMRAAESNITLQTALARVREARATTEVVAAGLWPTLNANGSYSRDRISAHGFPEFPPGIPLEGDVYQTGFDAAWELDVFGGTRRAREASRAEEQARELDQRDVWISVAAEVARNYVAARAYQRRLEVTDDNLQAQRQILDLTRELYSKGLTTALDVQQADALLAGTQAQVPSLENGFRASVYRLGLLLGQPPGSLLAELTNAAPIPAAPPVVPVGLPSDLLQRRPDVQSAEREIAAATAQVGVATADYYPKFSLTGDLGFQSVSITDWINNGSRFWSAGPTATWEVFDAGRIRANVRLQNERVSEKVANYEETMLSAFTDVETALTAYAKEQTRHISLERAADANAVAVGIARDQYTNGVTDYLRVLETQRSLYQSQDEEIQSEQAVAEDLIALYKALGGGWQPEGNKAE